MHSSAHVASARARRGPRAERLAALERAPPRRIDETERPVLEACRVLEQCSSALTCHDCTFSPRAASLASVRTCPATSEPPATTSPVSMAPPARGAYAQLERRARCAQNVVFARSGRRRRRRRGGGGGGGNRVSLDAAAMPLHDVRHASARGNQMVKRFGRAFRVRRARARTTAASLRLTAIGLPLRRRGLLQRCVWRRIALELAQLGSPGLDGRALGDLSRVAR